MSILSQSLFQQQQQQQQQPSASPRSSIVTVRSEIIRLVKFLGQFYNEQKELHNLCEETTTMSKECLIQLERLLQQTALIFINQQYQMLQVQEKIELVTSLKLWSQKAQYVRAIQIGSPSLDVDMQAYEEFLTLKRQQGMENQKQRLIYKLFLKSKSRNSNNNAKKYMPSVRRELPTVPSFDEVDVQQSQQQSQEQLLCFDSFEFLSQSQEDSKSTAGTNQEPQKLQANYACVAASMQRNQNIEIVSRILNKNNRQRQAVVKMQSSKPSFQANQFQQLEEKLISCLDKMNISSADNSALLKSSLAIATAISQDKLFFKSKQIKSVVGAIILAAVKISNIFVPINSISEASNTNEKLISKVFQQLQAAIPREIQEQPEKLVFNVSNQISPQFSVSNKIYQKMDIQVC